MKTSKFLLTLALVLGTATFSFAGPGPQYWQQRRNPPASQPKQAVAHDQVRSDRAEPANGCSGCSSCSVKDASSAASSAHSAGAAQLRSR
jgi:hypothetical protein